MVGERWREGGREKERERDTEPFLGEVEIVIERRERDIERGSEREKE